MSAGMKRVVAYAGLFAMALFAVANGKDPSAYVAALVLVQVL